MPTLFSHTPLKVHHREHEDALANGPVAFSQHFPGFQNIAVTHLIAPEDAA